MAFTWPRAPRVVSGSSIRAEDLALLADAVNARTLSGLGDAAWRLHYLLLGLFRGMRNPDETGFLHPATAEFFQTYQMLPPSGGPWPVADAGLPEGANVNNPLAGYVFGNEGAILDAEEDRLLLPVQIGGVTPATAEGLWQLAKLQRGAAVLSSGQYLIGAPALDAARHLSPIRYSTRGAWGNDFGGFLATPELLATPCDDPFPTDGFAPPLNLEHYFSGTRVDSPTSGLVGAVTTVDGKPRVTYAGTCFPVFGGNDYDDHISTITETDQEFVIYFNDAGLGPDRLLKSDYVIGPYHGRPRLSRQAGEQLPRSLHQFVRDFRGDAAQTAPNLPGAPKHGLPLEDWNSAAPDNQRFLTSQYVLAPQLGHIVGSDIEPLYHTATIAPTANAIAANTATANHTIPSGWLGCGWLLKADQPTSEVTVQLLVGGTVLETLMVDDTTTSALHYWPETPLAAGSVIAWRVQANCTFAPGSAGLTLELAELMPYKPTVADLALVLRLAGAKAA
jgi:hypothetical protein